MGHGNLICLRYDNETRRAELNETGSPEMAGFAVAMRDRYLKAAEGLLVGSSDRVHVVFDETLVQDNGHAGRRVSLAAETHELAQAIVDVTGTPVGRFDAIVLIGPQFIGWDGDEARMREVVASDLGYVIERLYPVPSQGPIKPLMPWLVQLAGAVLLQGAQASDDGEARVQRAVSRALKSASNALYPTWNAGGQLVTDYPAFPYLTEEVGKESLRSARTLVKPVSFEATARMVHEAVGRALTTLGVRIEARAA